jgi:hypothetical protein
VIQVGAVVGIVILVAVIGGYIAYGNWLTNGIKPRVFTTRVSADQLRRTFVDKVARAGWKVVDDGNPMVAQSSLATGIRQQIALELGTGRDGAMRVRVGPNRWVTSWGVPRKAHTIRMRMDSFVKAVQQSDGSIAVTRTELRGR